MIPITRKELYLNKIVGNNDYETPEKPITTEEFFFAEILGEAVQAPEPLTRYQMYLAKIAGCDIEIPYPETRLEYFLARAAGMDVETPTPITREEIFWSNYSAIVDFEVEGIPPLTFNAIAGTLKNYRIYGNTVNSESVGDKTENLWGAEIVDNYSSYPNGKISQYDGRCSNIEPIVVDGNSYTLSYLAPSDVSCIVTIKNSGELIKRQFKSGYEIVIDTTGGNELYITWLAGDAIPITSDMIQDVMLNTGSTALLYEPYGYKIPVTVEGKNLFNNIWELGNIRADNGQKEASNIMICSDYFPVEYDKTYSISRTISEGYNNVRGYDASKNYIGGGTTVCSVTNPFTNANAKKGIFKITNSLVAFVRFNHYTNNLNMKYMIVEGDYTAETMPSYEPYHAPVTTPIYLPEPIKMVGDEAEYIDYGEQKQYRVRKNLLPNTATSQEINGVTFTVNSGGSITCNGTANVSAPSILYIRFTLPIKLYELSGCPDSGSNNTYRVDIRNIDYSMYKYNGNNVVDYGTGCLFDGGNNQYCIRIAPGYTCNNLTFYPMIRKADIEDDTYEPYIENTDLDVTLPELPTLAGTNALTVGTEVQPSKVYIKGEKEREYS